MSGLSIGKYIEYCLGGNEELTRKVSGSVFPVIAPMDTDCNPPYIVYASDGFDSEDTKDGEFSDMPSVEVLACANSHEELMEVAELVRESMRDGFEQWDAREDGEQPFTVTDQTLRVGAEDYDLAHDIFYVPMKYLITVEY